MRIHLKDGRYIDTDKDNINKCNIKKCIYILPKIISNKVTNYCCLKSLHNPENIQLTDYKRTKLCKKLFKE